MKILLIKLHKNQKKNNNVVTEVILKGSPEEIETCSREIEFMIQNCRFMLYSERGITTKKEDKEIAHDMRIPSKICGMLIGSGGEHIKNLMMTTGCDIWVDWDRNSHIEAGVSTVHLKGSQKQVDAALEEIRRIIKLFGGPGGQGPNTITIELPFRCRKDIVGPKGATVRQLQSAHRVSVQVKILKSAEHVPTVQDICVVTITGEVEDVAQCQQKIEELVGKYIKCPQCQRLMKESYGR